MRLIKASSLLIILLSFTITIAQTDDPSLLTLERIFSSSEFSGERFGPARWLKDGSGYTTLERADGGGREIVRYDPQSGNREILVPISDLIPDGQTVPLRISDYSWSTDGKLLLIFTNTRRVWRQNTRGDYWILQLNSKRLWQLGGKFKPSTLMFAKFSPDTKKVGYVFENNIYIESIATGEIVQLTTDGSKTIINGTFDWVYEEEFGLRDGFHWSPNSRLIAFWQLDAEGVGEFYMINNTDSIYSRIIPVQYPKVGTTNSACRVGVVSADGGEKPRWFMIPGDPRNNYIARMDWAANSREVVMQYLNRFAPR